MKAYARRPVGFTENIALEEQERQREERRRQHASKLTGAHTTMPIKDMRMVNRWVQIAKKHDANRQRGGVSWYLLVLLGFNTGLRIGDLCKLRVRDVRDRERVRIIAEKTGKMTDIKLQYAAQKAISAALAGLDDDDWALGSRQKGRKDGQKKPISRQRCYGIITQIAREAGFDEHVGCHTMRKTFAWNMYKTTGNLPMLQKALNHSSQEVTLHYLGLDQVAMDEAIDKMPTIM
ncbi:MAG: tyrosine-type recombinase/integrase [Succinivibrionaceae bacterium]|nr:tyrosine-type recombinase/integrase [Succinivibrionaceae bacterium]